MSNKGKPAIYDISRLEQLGISPATALPLKLDFSDPCLLKEGIKKLFKIVDRTDAINRYKWKNLPRGVDGRTIERILHYRYQGAFFYLKSYNKFFFLPFSASGKPDSYGRPVNIIPLLFSGTEEDNGKPLKELIKGYELNVVYDILLEEEVDKDIFIKSAVILKDYSNGIPQYETPRNVLQEPLLDLMSNCLPYMNTTLMNSTGIQGMRVNDQDQYTNVELANQSIQKAALTGKPWIPIVGPIEFQELTSGTTGKAEEFLLALQSLDNLRLSCYGLKNGGLFQKKTTVLQSEENINNGNTGLIADDGLSLRKDFCDIINSIWGLGVDVEINETIIGVDYDLNGYIGSDNNNLDEVATSLEVMDDDM